MALICHCEGVKERAIVKAIHHGALTRDAVADACRAGTGCGGCHPAIDELLARHAVPAQVAAPPRRLLLNAG